MHTISLVSANDVARETRLFWFRKPEGFSFIAGQYTVLKLADTHLSDPRGPVRSLSFCSAPSEEHLGFTLRNTGSPFKQSLWTMEPGTEASITPPVGSFTLEPGDTRPVVYIVGGIGITPVRSMLVEAAHRGSERAFTLLYANRTREDIAFRDELRSLSLPHFRYVDVLDHEEQPSEGETDERGIITPELLARQVDSSHECVYYVVGSPSFTEAMKRILSEELAIPAEQQRYDAFTGLVSGAPKKTE